MTAPWASLNKMRVFYDQNTNTLLVKNAQRTIPPYDYINSGTGTVTIRRRFESAILSGPHTLTYEGGSNGNWYAIIPLIAGLEEREILKVTVDLDGGPNTILRKIVDARVIRNTS